MTRSLALFSPLLVAFAGMLPRLLSAQFGLLDDAVTLRVSGALRAHWPLIVDFARETGRFFPAYFGFFTVVRALAGDRPLGFFLANFVVLAAITAMLIGLVRLRGGTRLSAWAAGMFFVLSAASVENFYTLSKAEPPQLLWVMIALLLVGASGRASGRLRPAVLVAGAAATLLVAVATKETALVMLPISAGWLLAGRRLGTRTDTRLRARGLLVCAVAAAIFLAWRWWHGAPWIAGGRYTRLYVPAWANVRSSLQDWTTVLTRDYAHLVPLVLAVVVLSLLRAQPQRVLLLDSAIWMAGWMAVYLPWSWTFQYYLLPFTAGAAAFAGVALGTIVQAITNGASGWPRRIAAAGLAAFALLWPLTLANTASHAAVQLAVDAANHDLLRFAAGLPRGAALHVNLPAPSEYVAEIRLHLERLHRADVTIDHFPSRADTRPSAAYVATPRMLNDVPRSVRVAFDEAGATAWSAALERTLGTEPVLAYRTRHRAPRLLFNLHRPLCGTIGKDADCRAGPFRDTRVLSYGWDIYRLNAW